MAKRVLVLRPEPGMTATLEAARTLGLDTTGHALSEIRPRGWLCPDPASFDALLIGSANAIRHGGAQLAQLSEKPVYAVGQATAEVAQQAGFRIAMRGTGGLQKVLDALSEPVRFLRLTGHERVPLDVPDGVTMIEAIAYGSVSLPLDPADELLRSGDTIALLHSASTAAHFAAECDRLSLPRSTIALAGLGLRITDAAGEGWRAIHIPARPNDAELLAMVASL